VAEQFLSRMASHRFVLSARGLTHIPTHGYKVMDFQFIGAGTTYNTANLVADFLSLKLARLHSANPGLESFTLDMPDPQKRFTDFLALAHGDPILIDDESASVFTTFATLLENPELFQFLREAYPAELTRDTSLDVLSLLSRMSLPNSNEVDYAATNFFDYRQEKLFELPVDVFRAILRSSAFPAGRDEDLFSVLEAATRANPRYFDLFEYVSFEKLSLSLMSRFIQVTNSMGTSIALSSGVWHSLCRRLVQDVPPPGRPSDRPSGQTVRTISFDFGRPLLGILTFLSQQNGGGLHQKGIVKVSASSHFSNRVPENILNFSQDSYFYSEDAADQWIGYEFTSCLVTPDRYTLQTRQYGGGYHLQSWVIEGSRNGEDWTEMDRRPTVKEMDEQNFVKSFPIERPMQCAFLRLRQTGPNSNGRHQLTLSRFEIFGELRQCRDDPKGRLLTHPVLRVVARHLTCPPFSKRVSSTLAMGLVPMRPFLRAVRRFKKCHQDVRM
jgi:hypothetical protein